MGTQSSFPPTVASKSAFLPLTSTSNLLPSIPSSPTSPTTSSPQQSYSVRRKLTKRTRPISSVYSTFPSSSISPSSSASTATYFPPPQPGGTPSEEWASSSFAQLAPTFAPYPHLHSHLHPHPHAQAYGTVPRRSYSLLDPLPEFSPPLAQQQQQQQQQQPFDYFQSSSSSSGAVESESEASRRHMLMHIAPYMGSTMKRPIDICGSLTKAGMFQCGAAEGEDSEGEAEAECVAGVDEQPSDTLPAADLDAVATSSQSHSSSSSSSQQAPEIPLALPTARPTPKRRKASRRWSMAVTEIVDDLEFLHEMERQVAVDGKESIGFQDLLASTPAIEFAPPGPLGSDIDTPVELEGVKKTRLSESPERFVNRGLGDSEVEVEVGVGVDAGAEADANEGTALGYSPENGDKHQEEYNPYEEVGLLNTMKRAMMCVREIVRTERSYLAHLRSAREREVDSPTLAPFFAHLPDLIAASSSYSTALEADTSIWGVSAAFVSSSADLELVLTTWCSVVGRVIAAASSSPPLSSTSSPISSYSPSSSSNPSISRSSSSGTGGSHSNNVAKNGSFRIARAGSLHSIFSGRRGRDRDRTQSMNLASSLVMSPSNSTPPAPKGRSNSMMVRSSSPRSDEGHTTSSPNSGTNNALTVTGSGTVVLRGVPLFRTPSTASSTGKPSSGTLGLWRRTSTTTSGGHSPRQLTASGLVSSLSWRTRRHARTLSDGATFNKNNGAMGPSRGSGPGAKELSLQDITIMPTQRVGRYVMLYRDLLKLTPPTSRSYYMVQEAVNTALRIAKKCDEAQTHLALSAAAISSLA